MITERDLQEAIAECEGQRNPNANTCIKLAAFYTIKNELFPSKEYEPLREIPDGYSHGDNHADVVMYDSGTEFSEAIRGMDPADVFPIIDELMESIKVVIPRLYDSVLTKLKER